MAIVLKVRGTPVPQGSMTCVGGGFRAVNGKTVAAHNVQPSNKADLYPWRNKIAAAAKIAVERHHIYFVSHDPVRVDVTFTVERPKTVDRDWPSVAPDEDKLRRAVLDGLTAGAIWGDDGQSIGGVTWKTYPHMAAFAPFPEDVLTDGTFGVVIRLTEITGHQLPLI